jgi:hypothetical protein
LHKDFNLKKLDSIISYPYGRPHPIPPINNKQELEKRYSEIFDDSLTSVIINSNIKKIGLIWVGEESCFIMELFGWTIMASY